MAASNAFDGLMFDLVKGRHTLRAEIFTEQIFPVGWSETCKFREINFRGSQFI